MADKIADSWRNQWLLGQFFIRMLHNPMLTDSLPPSMGGTARIKGMPKALLVCFRKDPEIDFQPFAQAVCDRIKPDNVDAALP